ncbi:hypothetical protein A3D05_01975 [Candidatus Gottesmanbacteria bacterium RIFCSPHIGHO2_02_FULL_40_24]|nr:MAG: hypothetical protein A3D05_01975 [Candidatus Gottesmanbacteria bacterium RIFCSPHIGHO2_02_FULL_40_24]
MNKYKPIASGITAGSFLLLFYFITMTYLAGSFETTLMQFKKLWFYMIPLSLGFGVQIGLYVSLKNLTDSSGKLAAANSAVSTVGMIACCAHHLTDILPLIGLSFLTFFIIQYQVLILIIAIISNILSIIYLLGLRQKLISA